MVFMRNVGLNPFRIRIIGEHLYYIDTSDSIKIEFVS